MSEVVSSSDFQSKVLDAQGPVLVDFFATWCGPCKMLAPTLDEVAAETAGKAAVYKLDIDQSPDIAQKYGVMSVPTVIVFENGQVKKQDETFLSSKREGEGIGLSSIRTLCAKYHGVLKITPKDNTFTVNLLLNLPAAA